MARPSKFTAERCGRFLVALHAGAFRETAARHAGWSPATFYRILRLTTPEAVAFREDILRVETELELRLAGTVTQAAFQDPRLAIAMLERRFSERWGRRASAGPVLEETTASSPRGSDQPVIIDPAIVDVLVPRLLEAQIGATSREDVADFAHRRPRSAGDAS